METQLPDNDNNALLDPKVKAEALIELSKRLTRLHEAIDQANEVLGRLTDKELQERQAT